MLKKSVAFLALYVVSSVSHADTVGKWMTGELRDHSGLFAGTVNDSGDVLAEYCYYSSKICEWSLLLDSTCEKDHESPILANTDQGASSLTIVCLGEQKAGKYGYTFRNWQDLEKLMKSGERVGLAMPMQGDQFKVHRFLLDGINQTTTSVEKQIFASVQPAKPKGEARPVSDTTTDVL